MEMAEEKKYSMIKYINSIGGNAEVFYRINAEDNTKTFFITVGTKRTISGSEMKAKELFFGTREISEEEAKYYTDNPVRLIEATGDSGPKWKEEGKIV